ncbi:cation diffusion facilitator family transporter [Methanosphaera sp. WGK6]|uniref:cation diffusion facilitator family transporter n=1 Tax=Methanosphaera sp. WGK6 TaxID=1561964 RepID=UPI000A00E32C|nr:cation diffusion facilitator family transporter [Methanosphaera sp. WGK6]
METYYRQVNKILTIVLVVNMFMAFVKIVCGFHYNILSMTTDGYDSLFDGISNIVGIIAIWMSSKPHDSKHRYGYYKIETFASIFIAILLFVVGYEIIVSAIDRFNGVGTPSVTFISFLILLIILIINIILAIYEYRKGVELKSDLLISDSQHVKSDALSTTVVLIGLIFIYYGYIIIDSILSVLIAILIFKVGFEVLYKNMNVLLDKTMINEKEIRSILSDIPEIEDIHNIRSRGTPASIFFRYAYSIK